MVSGRVVATVSHSSCSPTTRYRTWYSFPRSSRYSTSSSLNAVSATGSQFTIRTLLYTSPFLCRSMNVSITLSEYFSSIVNRVRSQSQLAPSFFNCSRMMPPCSRVHSHACSRNASRLRSALRMPCSRNRRTTVASVAREAWSVPGTQHAFLPCIRARRTSTSWMVLLSMWPMCSTPVTLGGGITTQYGSRASGSE